MSESYFENAMRSLKKPHEIDRLQKILVAIRKEVDWPGKKANIYKLQEKGCLKHIVGCLLKNQIAILNTTLSILGNCCMIREIAKELINEHGILNNISHVLKRQPRDSIRGRAFRILGNMCQHQDYHGNLILNKNPQLHIVSSIVSFLKLVGKSNEFCTDESDKNDNIWSNATICMAIRALREIVSTNTSSQLVELDVIKAIGMITIKFTPKWVNTRQHEDILDAVLKLLHIYSNHNDVNLIPHLQNCGTGNAMDFLGKLLFLSPYVLVKIIMNLLKTSNLRSDLPISDISENLIQKLGCSTNFTKGREDLQHREYLKCLCFLMHHPANKDNLRNVGLIPAFISILKEYVEETELSLKNSILIISNLRICMYDEVSLLEMLKFDIINALILKLDWAVGANDSCDLSHIYRCDTSSRKRRKFITNKCFMHKLTSDGLGFPCCSIRSDAPCNYIKYNKERSLSPSSDISLSSGPSSPSNPILSDDEDSDDYSPVCSDSEDNGCLQNNQSMEDEDVVYNPSPYYDEIEMATNKTGSCDDKSLRNPKKGLYTLCIEIVKMVKLFTKLRPVVMELVTTDLLVKLLNFLFPKNANVCPPDTLAVILLIVETPQYLLRLMQTDFIAITYKLSIMSHGVACVTCTNLNCISRAILFKFTIIVESGSGKGDIAHQLHRASQPVKQRLVAAIPFITANKYLLAKLMIDCGGLNILLQSVQEPSSIQLKCICSLSALAIKLGIKNPAANHQEPAIFMPIDIEKYQISDHCSTTVCFKLDDSSCIQADRDFLCLKSEYFRCLLSGEFKESCENEITLHNVPNNALRLLFILLQFDVVKTEIYKIDVDLDLLLAVILLSESYLLSDLCNCLILSVQYYKFLPSSIPVIYKWSLESGTDILRIESVAYALVAELDDSERNCMFSTLLDLGHSDKIADDIRKLLARYLKPTKHL